MSGDGFPNGVFEIESVDRVPSLARVVDDFRFAVWKQKETQLKPFVHHLANRIRYGRATPERYRLIQIDPTEVDYLLTPHFWNRTSKYATHVKDGNWDRRYSDEHVMILGRNEGIEEPTLIEFENYQLYISARNHFEKGVPWTETELYEWLMNKWVPSNPDTYQNWYGSESQVKAALAGFDELYQNMKGNGYLTQQELQEHDDAPSPSDPSQHVPEHHEVAVNIGRDGEIIFDDGRHRFIAAKILGLEQIPVRVLVRHREWQTLRNEVAHGSSDAEQTTAKTHLQHPDMQDVV